MIVTAHLAGRIPVFGSMMMETFAVFVGSALSHPRSKAVSDSGRRRNIAFMVRSDPDHRFPETITDDAGIAPALTMARVSPASQDPMPRSTE